MSLGRCSFRLNFFLIFVPFVAARLTEGIKDFLKKAVKGANPVSVERFLSGNGIVDGVDTFLRVQVRENFIKMLFPNLGGVAEASHVSSQKDATVPDEGPTTKKKYLGGNNILDLTFIRKGPKTTLVGK